MQDRAENLTRYVKAMTPTVFGLIGVLLLASPLRLVEGLVPIPLIPLVVVYFWSIYSPSYLPSVSVFAIGLFQDLLSGGPIGLWPCIYLFVQYLVLSQRSYFHGREQRVVWLGFTVAAVFSSFILWAVMSMLAGFPLPAWQLVIQMTSTIAVYPLVANGFAELHRRVIVEV
ncbi:MAG: rod shape-determining protein MreD [Pseudomonadota bacterium]